MPGSRPTDRPEALWWASRCQGHRSTHPTSCPLNHPIDLSQHPFDGQAEHDDRVKSSGASQSSSRVSRVRVTSRMGMASSSWLISAGSKTRPPVSRASSARSGRLSDGSSISRLGGSTRNVVVETRTPSRGRPPSRERSAASRRRPGRPGRRPSAGRDRRAPSRSEAARAAGRRFPARRSARTASASAAGSV